MISIRQQPSNSHIVASLFYIFKRLGKCIISPGKVRSGPKTLVHYNLYLYMLINKKINVDLSELCQEEKKVYLHLQHKLYLFLLMNKKINVNLSELCQEEEEKVFPSLVLTATLLSYLLHILRSVAMYNLSIFNYAKCIEFE